MIEFITNNKCNCKINTTISNGYNEDNCEINKCKCKDCYEGSNCNKCKSNCYLNNQTLECVKCPCDLNKSDGLCLFDQDYDSIRCNSCILPSIGLLCDECDAYYYKSLSNDCLPCTCNSNSNPLARRHCNDLDGECINCSFNTTGKHCELCLKDYVGYPLNKTCIHMNDAQRIEHKSHVPMEFKSLFIFTFSIFAVLFAILSLIYYFNKINSSNEGIPIINSINRLISYIKQRNSNFNGLFTFKRRFMPANGGDDDLNLAENQIFDECLFTDDFYNANQPNNKINKNNLLPTTEVVNAQNTSTNSNPYCNLTVST